MPLNKTYYFDYASCTPINEEILNTYFKLLKDYYVNSESIYSKGIEVNNLVNESRKRIAEILEVKPEEILFTSGASESNSFAVKGYALLNQNRGKHIITSKMEHSSVLNSIKQLEDFFGFEVDYLDVEDDGRVSLKNIKQHLRTDTLMVCIMAVNNEIGSIQDISTIGKYIHSNSRAVFMVDGVQQIGKEPVDLSEVDLYAFTTHKLYGIKGCGILYKKANLKLLPLINGGQQEEGLRGGTLNAPACIVAAKTLRLAVDSLITHHQYVEKLNIKLRNALNKIDDIVINSPKDATPYILNFSCISIGSEIMMNALNSRNICVSAQSTCSSRTKEPSHTLKAMGKADDIAYGSIRVSFSDLSTDDELNYLIESVKEIVNDYRTK